VWRKNVMANEIAGFGGLNLFLVILSETVIKFIIGFGRFTRILEDQWKHGITILNIQQNKIGVA
jgi:hypothetical protein